MLEKAKIDREKVKSLLKKGISREEAIKSFNTDDNFNNWLEDLRKSINAVT
ncbi:hypothetical protein [Clostridium beijerinckii]|nr:hypothetical protein [Clostridium beijerinckii]NRY11672.1 putative metal-binding transcription factor (methanogenesis marker protein 9) [Clostridium beijerinckii]